MWLHCVKIVTITIFRRNFLPPPSGFKEETAYPSETLVIVTMLTHYMMNMDHCDYLKSHMLRSTFRKITTWWLHKIFCFNDYKWLSILTWHVTFIWQHVLERSTSKMSDTKIGALKCTLPVQEILKFKSFTSLIIAFWTWTWYCKKSISHMKAIK
jgi:hypothetical protein